MKFLEKLSMWQCRKLSWDLWKHTDPPRLNLTSCLFFPWVFHCIFRRFTFHKSNLVFRYNLIFLQKYYKMQFHQLFYYFEYIVEHTGLKFEMTVFHNDLYIGLIMQNIWEPTNQSKLVSTINGSDISSRIFLRSSAS